MGVDVGSGRAVARLDGGLARTSGGEHKGEKAKKRKGLYDVHVDLIGQDASGIGKSDKSGLCYNAGAALAITNVRNNPISSNKTWRKRVKAGKRKG